MKKICFISLMALVLSSAHYCGKKEADNVVPKANVPTNNSVPQLNQLDSSKSYSKNHYHYPVYQNPFYPKNGGCSGGTGYNGGNGSGNTGGNGSGNSGGN